MRSAPAANRARTKQLKGLRVLFSYRMKLIFEAATGQDKEQADAVEPVCNAI